MKHRPEAKKQISPRRMTGGESRACVHHAQRCRISDVTPVVERGMGHRFPVVLRLTAE